MKSNRDPLFERWLRKRAIDAALHARRIVEEKEDDDVGDDEVAIDVDIDDEDGGDEDVESIEADIKDVEQEDEGPGRGGPQQARAARREQPAPDPDDIDLSMLTKKLNAIRSGQSLKDDHVQKRIAEYYNDLSIAQRLALFAFLEGLAEIIAGDMPGDEARAPNDPDIGVDMEYEEPEADELADTSDAERVEKPGVKEYEPDDRQGEKRVSKRRKRTSDSAAPNVKQDAGEGMPVRVVRR